MNPTRHSRDRNAIVGVILFVCGTACMQGGADGRCPTPLTGAAMFGRPLRGSAAFENPRTGVTQESAVEMQVFFPAGRLPGAPVIFALPSWGGLETARAVLRADNSATFVLSGSDGQDLSINGTLVGSGEGVGAFVTRNFADRNSDVPVPAAAEMTLCPDGELPPPRLLASQQIAPDSPIVLVFDSPADPSPMHVAAQLRDGTSVDVDVRPGAQSLVVMPRSGAFPPGKTLELAIDGAADAIGRPFPNLVTVEPALEVPVPAGKSAWVRGSMHDERVDAVFGLGERETNTSARLAVSWEVGCSDVRLTVVSADGKSTRATIASEAREFEGSVPLPGPGKQWLSVYASKGRARPQWLFPAPCSIEVKALALE